VISPDRPVAVDGLITGWHDPTWSSLPPSPGEEMLVRSYATAHTLGYHGHEFDDFRLILPSRP